MEKLQKAMDNLATFLKTTKCLGSECNNPIREIRVIDYGSGEYYARPIFKDGAGEKEAFRRQNGKLHGYYDVFIGGDSPDGAVFDVWEKFVKDFI